MINKLNLCKNKIGGLEFENPFFMAPLAGITDAPTRLIYKQMGAALVYSEMVSAKGMYYGDRKSDELLTILPEEGQVAFQIFGREPEIMAYAADKLSERTNCLLDINMGCPVPKVFKNGEGSALMAEPNQVYKILKAVTEATDKPVTVKLRTGISSKSVNCVEVALAAQEGGAAAVAVHGRTREQYYSGEADWNEIAKVKDALKIPVIGNGDIVSWESAKSMALETGCDYLMIGRAALGNPWIFAQLKLAYEMYNAGETSEYIQRHLLEEAVPTMDEKKRMMIHHLNMLCRYKGERIAVREMRKHLGWYTKGMPGGSSFRGMVNGLEYRNDIIKAIEKLH